MKTEIGEYIVGAYLKQILGCDIIDYNVRPKEKGLSGLAELDVVGLRFHDNTAFICEVTTHLDGVLYGTYDLTEKKIKEKFERQKKYAAEYLKQFKPSFQFWSPVVSSGMAKRLQEIHGLDLVINKEYSKRVRELQALAKESTKDFGNPFFRTLQILEHLK